MTKIMRVAKFSIINEQKTQILYLLTKVSNLNSFISNPHYLNRDHKLLQWFVGSSDRTIRKIHFILTATASQCSVGGGGNRSSTLPLPHRLGVERQVSARSDRDGYYRFVQLVGLSENDIIMNSSMDELKIISVLRLVQIIIVLQQFSKMLKSQKCPQHIIRVPTMSATMSLVEIKLMLSQNS